MCAPGVAEIAADLHITSTVVSTLAITLYVLGISIGPMFTSPLSEIYGRVPVYHGTTFIFVIFIIGGALSKTTTQYMVFRFISGCAGGTPMALGGGSIADLSTVQQRAMAMALFSLGPLAGPVSLCLFSRPLHLVRIEFVFEIVLTAEGLGPWSRYRWLCCSWQRLALDLLASSHSRRSVRHCIRGAYA